MAEPLLHLPEHLAAFLQSPRLVQLHTLEAGTGAPFVNTLSWVLALHPGEIRLAGDVRTRFMQNLQADSRVALTVLGAGTAWTVYGEARLLTERTPGIPFPLGLAAVTGLRVHESLFWGARLTQEPLWEVTYSAEEAARLDEAIFRAMREFEA